LSLIELSTVSLGESFSYFDSTFLKVEMKEIIVYHKHDFSYRNIRGSHGESYYYCADCQKFIEAGREERAKLDKKDEDEISKFTQRAEEIITKEFLPCTSFWNNWLASSASSTEEKGQVNFYTDWFPHHFVSPLLTEYLPCTNVADIISDYLLVAPQFSLSSKKSNKDSFKFSVILNSEKAECSEYYILVTQYIHATSCYEPFGPRNFKYKNVIAEGKKDTSISELISEKNSPKITCKIYND
jgi:hypothetical protein